jgi:membrane protein YqaA with SNARE-associated domain
VASTGNVLGSVVNWGLGRGIERFRSRRWFPASEAALERAQRGYQRYGKWSLLLSWVPIIGDPLTVIAGVLREPFITFVLLVTVAKVGRYLMLTALTLGVS